MENLSNFSQLQKNILSDVRNKLNVMISEVCQCQLKESTLDFSNQEKLTYEILCMISCKKINSVHITPEEATHFLGLLDKVDYDQKSSSLN